MVEMQQGGWLQNDGSAEKASPAHEEGAQTGEASRTRVTIK
jgi:hypothetical protein